MLTRPNRILCIEETGLLVLRAFDNRVVAEGRALVRAKGTALRLSCPGGDKKIFFDSEDALLAVLEVWER
ncbi:hypothetical protein FNF28_07778 [Cafeteria roenbergensis]|nr:hypothetical protein FNF28_07778 [Cafeteria roenbergensis]